MTLNYGARFDAVEEFTHESEISPRVNLAWKPPTNTTLHIGNARYFVQLPFESLSPASIAQVQGTTAAPQVTQDDVVRAERSNYYDVGVSQVVIPGLTMGVDAYYKVSKNLIDEGQFGAPIILTAFNYAAGIQTEVELTASYEHGPLSLYGNPAWSRAIGNDIDSAQFNFSAAGLAFIQNNYIHLDHNQTWSGSAGAAYMFREDTANPTRVSADLLVQSGLRANGGVPNGIARPSYATANLSVVQRVAARTDVRLDILNVADTPYEIRNGTGVGSWCSPVWDSADVPGGGDTPALRHVMHARRSGEQATGRAYASRAARERSASVATPGEGLAPGTTLARNATRSDLSRAAGEVYVRHRSGTAFARLPW